MPKRTVLSVLFVLSVLSTSLPASAESPYIYGTHFWREGENLDCFNGKVGWITELKTAPEYAAIDQTAWKRIVDEGHTIILRVDYDGDNTWAPSPDLNETYASRYAHWAERFKDYCHIYIIGNEDGVNYDCFKAVRNAIHAVQPEAILCPGAPGDHLQPTIDLKDYIDGYVVHGVSTGWIPGVDAAWPSAKTKPIYVTETAGDPPMPADRMRTQLAEINAWNTTHAHKVQAVCKFVYYEYGQEYSSQQMEPMQSDDFREATATTSYLNSYANPYIGVTNVSVSCNTETSATIAWDTNASATAQIEYWRDGERTQNWSSFQSSYTTSHSIALTGLTPGVSYSYMIKSWATDRPLSLADVRGFVQIGPGTGTISGAVRDRAGKPIDGARVVRNPGGYAYYSDAGGSYVIRGVPAGSYSLQFFSSEVGQRSIAGVSVSSGATSALDAALSQKTNHLTNTGFESGTTGWTAYSAGLGSQSGSWFGGITAHTGSAFVGTATNGPGSSGGVYQRVAVPNASGYAARVYSCIYRGDCPYIEVKSRVGIDPTGGTNPGAGSVVWSSYDYGFTPWDWLWKELVTPSVTVSGGYATVFLDYAQLVSPGWHIDCFDDAGLYGPALQTQAVATVSDLKQVEDGVPVSVSGRIATTNRTDFGDRIYIEDPDRVAGIVVYFTGSPSVSEGNAVSVTGTMTTVNGERAITQATVTASSGTAVGPLGIVNRAVGGGAGGGYNAGPPAVGQRGVLGGVGLNDVGLLVRVFGTVQSHGTGYVMLTDGSGAAIKIDTSHVSPQPGDGQFIAATGVVSVETSGADLAPVVRARRSSDVQPL